MPQEWQDPKGRKVCGWRFRPGLIRQMRAQARREGRPVQDVAAKALREYLKRQKEAA